MRAPCGAIQGHTSLLSILPAGLRCQLGSPLGIDRGAETLAGWTRDEDNERRMVPHGPAVLNGEGPSKAHGRGLQRHNLRALWPPGDLRAPEIGCEDVGVREFNDRVDQE